jgi:hypothetical protein
MLGLGKLLASLRPDVTYPGDLGAVVHRRARPPCAVSSPRAKDTEWIPIVSRQGLLVLTRDRHIQQHAAELEAVKAVNGWMVARSSTDAGTTWGQLEVVITQWRQIEALLDVAGPFVYSVSRTVLAKLL